MWASSTWASSPSWVLAATQLGRPAKCSARKRAPRSGTSGGNPTSALRLPVTWIRAVAAPSDRNRSASRSLWAPMTMPWERAYSNRPLKRRYRSTDRGEMRALASTRGMPRRPHSAYRFGHSSVSMVIASFGGMRAKKRRTGPGVS